MGAGGGGGGGWRNSMGREKGRPKFLGKMNIGEDY